jgi:hypothetical protein
LVGAGVLWAPDEVGDGVLVAAGLVVDTGVSVGTLVSVAADVGLGVFVGLGVAVKVAEGGGVYVGKRVGVAVGGYAPPVRYSRITPTRPTAQPDVSLNICIAWRR